MSRAAKKNETVTGMNAIGSSCVDILAPCFWYRLCARARSLARSLADTAGHGGANLLLFHELHLHILRELALLLQVCHALRALVVRVDPDRDDERIRPVGRRDIGPS
jgi:hypothetical protein